MGGIDAYKIRINYLALYPKFGKEMYDLDMNKDLGMKGKATIDYGPGKNGCGNPEGSLEAKFTYSTTAEGRESLKEKSFYKECMALKDSTEWKGRQALPMKMPCLQSVWYGSQA